MKILSRITLVIAFVCTLIIMNPMNVEAATGRIMFSDPTIAAGEQFDLSVKVVSYEGTMDTISVDLKYDSSKLEFISGTSSSGGDGSIKLSATSTSTENIYLLKFRALKNGDASVTISSQTIKSTDGDTFLIQEGNSAISIEGGTEVSASSNTDTATDDEVIEEIVDDSVIQIAGVVYEISEGFIESEIPAGYSKEKREIRGENISVLKGDSSGIILVYLVAPGETIVQNEYGYTPKGRFFRYDEGTGKFGPYVQITVSDTTYIVFLTEDYEVDMPMQYIPTTMTADGFDFPAWQDAELEGYYLVYAISSNGDKLLYRYDVNDQAYQRFEMPEEPENPNKVDNETMQLIIDTMANNLIIVLSIIGLLFLLLMILVITFGVKLRNRNREIDDIYEEGVTAYNNRSYGDREVRKEKKSDYNHKNKTDEFEDSFEDSWDDGIKIDLIGTTESEKPTGMLDDGLTQEFDITMGDDFDSDGFVDYSKPVKRTANRQQVSKYEPYGEMNQADFSQMNTNSNIGTFSRYQANDDDDIEFIEI